jgi:hypothetical protein
METRVEKSEPERTGGGEEEKAPSLVAQIDARLRSYGIDVGDQAIGAVLAGGAVALSAGLVTLAGHALERALPPPRSRMARLARGLAGLVVMNVLGGTATHYALQGASALGAALARERSAGRRATKHHKWRVAPVT